VVEQGEPVQQVEEESMQHVEEADAGDVADFVAFDSGTPLRHACIAM
jgi:hypothetical protein